MKTEQRIRPMVLLAVVFAVLSPEPTSAQQLPRLEYDETEQVFLLSYLDDEGTRQTVEIIGSNRIRPEVQASVEDENGTFVYRYAVRNRDHPGSEQSVGVWQMPCPQVSSVLAPDLWSADVDESTVVGGVACDFGYQREEKGIAPSEVLTGFAVVSAFLPGIATARLEGIIDELPELPGIEGETPREIAELYSRALGAASEPGVLAGWRTVKVVAPLRDPADFRESGALLSALRSDLDRACELDWISKRGVCRSLEAKLQQARSSLERGRTEATGEQLEAFLAELKAQHGPQPGKHVNDNAFHLLTTNAEFLLERL